MDTVLASNEIEHAKRPYAVGNPDFPDATPNNRRWPAVQRPLADLQQVQLAVNIPPYSFRKLSDDVECVSVPVNRL